MEITHEFLIDNGELLTTAEEGTCCLYEYNGIEYVVLCDNSVITREEDNEMGPEFAIFKYVAGGVYIGGTIEVEKFTRIVGLKETGVVEGEGEDF